MRRRLMCFAGVALAALVLIVPQILWAQGELTLEGLAEKVDFLFASREEFNSRIAVLETRTAPTATPTPTLQPLTATPRATATRKPPTSQPTATAMSQSCRMSDVPDPPPYHKVVNCEAWGVTYKLVTLASGRTVDNMLPMIIREFYPLVVDSARNCRVSPTRLGDLVYRGSEQMKRLGKPTEGSAIGYLLGVMSDRNFTTVVDESGGCVEAIVVVIMTAE